MWWLCAGSFGSMYTCSTDAHDLYRVCPCRLWPCVGCMLMFPGGCGPVYTRLFNRSPGVGWKAPSHLWSSEVGFRTVCSKSPGSVLNKNKVLQAPSRQMRNLQGQSMGVWVLTCALGNSGAKPCLRTGGPSTWANLFIFFSRDQGL